MGKETDLKKMSVEPYIRDRQKGKVVTEPIDFLSKSIFCIASCSKLFIAIAIGILIDDDTILPNGRRLEWKTKIKDILPEWQLMSADATDHADLIDLLGECRL